MTARSLAVKRLGPSTLSCFVGALNASTTYSSEPILNEVISRPAGGARTGAATSSQTREPRFGRYTLGITRGDVTKGALPRNSDCNQNSFRIAPVAAKRPAAARPPDHAALRSPAIYAAHSHALRSTRDPPKPFGPGPGWTTRFAADELHPPTVRARIPRTMTDIRCDKSIGIVRLQSNRHTDTIGPPHALRRGGANVGGKLLAERHVTERVVSHSAGRNVSRHLEVRHRYFVDRLEAYAQCRLRQRDVDATRIRPA